MQALRHESNLSRDMRKGIGLLLRASYEALVKQGLPARHINLLQKLEERDPVSRAPPKDSMK
jgi:hypothetical protein